MSKVVAAALVLVMATSAVASDDSLREKAETSRQKAAEMFNSDDLNNLIDQANETVKQAAEAVAERAGQINPLDTPEFGTAYERAQAATGIQEENITSFQSTRDSNERNQNQIADNRDIIFISSSMSRVQLQELFVVTRQEALRPVFVLRGLINEGGTIEDTMAWIQDLLVQTRPRNVDTSYTGDPTVMIHPQPFIDYNIQRVPARLVRGDGEDYISYGVVDQFGVEDSLLGNSKPLNLEVSRPARELERRGATLEIAETNLFEDIQNRIAQLDTDALVQRAYDRYWQNQDWQSLPTVEMSNTEEVDPSVVLQQDIVGPYGNYLARAGDVLNPLDEMTFDRTLIAINPTDEVQLVIARYEIDRARRENPYAPVYVMITTLGEQTNDGYQAVANTLNEHIYILTPELRSTFRLRAVPAVVTANNDKKVFEVRYIAPEVAACENC